MALNRKYIIPITIVAIAGSLLYFLYDPSYSNLFPKCFFHSLTNLDCPGCGSQRAIHQLLNGNIIRAADYNLLVVIFIPLLVYAAIVYVGKNFFGKSWEPAILYSPLLTNCIVVIVILFWICRNLPYPGFKWLSAGA